MDKNLIRVPLTELRTYDEEVIGSVYRKDGKAYRWIKNYGSTSLVADGACLDVITSVEANVHKKVIHPHGAGASTASVQIVAGVPMTAIGPSGSDTGDHGWIQVRGARKVSIMQSSAATGQAIGCFAIATSVQPATAPFDQGYAPTANSAATAYLYAKRVQILKSLTSTGPATAASALVDIQCL